MAIKNSTLVNNNDEILIKIEFTEEEMIYNVRCRTAHLNHMIPASNITQINNTTYHIKITYYIEGMLELRVNYNIIEDDAIQYTLKYDKIANGEPIRRKKVKDQVILSHYYYDEDDNLYFISEKYTESENDHILAFLYKDGELIRKYATSGELNHEYLSWGTMPYYLYYDNSTKLITDNQTIVKAKLLGPPPLESGTYQIEVYYDGVVTEQIHFTQDITIP